MSQYSISTRRMKHDYLYRILPFHYLVELFEMRALSLSCPKSWDDPYESMLGDKALDSTFAQCWCRLGVSDAIWRIYSPDRYSVRIKTTTRLLRDQLTAGLCGKDRFRFKMGEVEYKPTSVIEKLLKRHLSALQKSGDVTHALAPLFVKRRAFKHESEYRVAVFDQRRREGRDRLRIPVDPHKLVLSVLADPRAPDAIVEVFKHYLQREIGFRGRVGKSALYERVEPPHEGRKKG